MVPGASRHCPRQAPVMPLILVITDVDTPPVHCKRHFYVYHFVSLRPTQTASEYSIEAALGGAGWVLIACDCYCIWGDTLDAYFKSLESIQTYIIMCHS
jgi:hypothetical protein